jgi:iron only hydrogenase large subunit-like protein
LGISTGAADIFANTGGVMEAALRTVHAITTGRNIAAENLHIEPLAGLDGIKTAAVTLTGTVDAWYFLEGKEVKVAVAHGLGNAATLIEHIRKHPDEFQFVEIMTCPGGCIGGGGQPRFTTDEVRKARMHAIYREDEGKELRQSHENPAIQALYNEFLGKPLGEKSHHLLHTEYERKPKVTS